MLLIMINFKKNINIFIILIKLLTNNKKTVIIHKIKSIH